MAQNVRLEIVTPEKAVVSEEVEIVMAPGSDGEFGVLHGHTPFLSTLQMGILRYKDVNGNERALFIDGGFAEALPDKVTVLAEIAERRSDIDVERARKARERAMQRLEKNREAEIDFTRANAALRRALFRLKLVGTH
jgi:F-type H+-transporting ATPase subunit epsilon